MDAFKFNIGQVIASKRHGDMKVLFRWHRPPGPNVYDVQFLKTERNCTYDEKELEAIHEVQTNRKITNRQ